MNAGDDDETTVGPSPLHKLRCPQCGSWQVKETVCINCTAWTCGACSHTWDDAEDYGQAHATEEEREPLAFQLFDEHGREVVCFTRAGALFVYQARLVFWFVLVVATAVGIGQLLSWVLS